MKISSPTLEWSNSPELLSERAVHLRQQASPSLDPPFSSVWQTKSAQMGTEDKLLWETRSRSRLQEAYCRRPDRHSRMQPRCSTRWMASSPDAFGILHRSRSEVINMLQRVELLPITLIVLCLWWVAGGRGGSYFDFDKLVARNL